MAQKLLIVVALILTGLTYDETFAHSGAMGIVKERMDYFKASSRDLKKIRTYIKNETYSFELYKKLVKGYKP